MNTIEIRRLGIFRQAAIGVLAVLVPAILQAAWAVPQNRVETVPDAGYVEVWGRLLDELRFRAEDVQVEEVNRFVNTLRARSDREVWGQADYWAAPEEFFRRAAGDCEDFAIAKYASLRRLGVPDARLRLLRTRVYNPKKRQIEPHMVLVYIDSQRQKWVLDNYEGQVLMIEQRSNMLFDYAFNNQGLWFLDNRGEAVRQADLSKLAKWQTLRGSLQPILSDQG